MPISPLPPLRPHAISARSLLAGLDITGDGKCQHQWWPLLGTLLFGVLAEGPQCHQPGVLCPWLPYAATTSAHPLESRQQLGCHGRHQRGVVLQGQPGLAQALRHPTPCPGCQRPWAPGKGWGGPVPLAGLASEHEGVLHKCFLSQPAPGQCLGRAVGGRGWEAGARGLFTATELVSFHLPRGKQLAIC